MYQCIVTTNPNFDFIIFLFYKDHFACYQQSASCHYCVNCIYQSLKSSYVKTNKLIHRFNTTTHLIYKHATVLWNKHSVIHKWYLLLYLRCIFEIYQKNNGYISYSHKWCLKRICYRSTSFYNQSYFLWQTFNKQIISQVINIW